MTRLVMFWLLIIRSLVCMNHLIYVDMNHFKAAIEYLVCYLCHSILSFYGVLYGNNQPAGRFYLETLGTLICWLHVQPPSKINMVQQHH